MKKLRNSLRLVFRALGRAQTFFYVPKTNQPCLLQVVACYTQRGCVWYQVILGDSGDYLAGVLVHCGVWAMQTKWGAEGLWCRAAVLLWRAPGEITLLPAPSIRWLRTSVGGGRPTALSFLQPLGVMSLSLALPVRGA